MHTAPRINAQLQPRKLRGPQTAMAAAVTAPCYVAAPSPLAAPATAAAVTGLNTIRAQNCYGGSSSICAVSLHRQFCYAFGLAAIINKYNMP